MFDAVDFLLICKADGSHPGCLSCRALLMTEEGKAEVATGVTGKEKEEYAVCVALLKTAKAPVSAVIWARFMVS